MKFFIPAIFLLVNFFFTNAKEISFSIDLYRSDTITLCDTILTSEIEPIASLVIWNTDSVFFAREDSPVFFAVSDSAQLQKRSNKKVIAAILAFPLPFGILGVHRIFLGTKPYMPFAYIGTLGGGVGILPLIDFISILTADDETFMHFENNPRVFMWTH